MPLSTHVPLSCVRTLRNHTPKCFTLTNCAKQTGLPISWQGEVLRTARGGRRRAMASTTILKQSYREVRGISRAHIRPPIHVRRQLRSAAHAAFRSWWALNSFSSVIGTDEFQQIHHECIDLGSCYQRELICLPISLYCSNLAYRAHLQVCAANRFGRSKNKIETNLLSYTVGRNNITGG